MRNGPRNYWETDRLLLLGTQRRGRGRDLQVLILRIRRKEEEEEEEEENNNNNANNKEEDDAVDEDDYNENDDDGSSSSNKRPSAGLRVTKITTIMRSVLPATSVFRKQKGEKWVICSTCVYQWNEVCARNSSGIPKFSPAV